MIDLVREIFQTMRMNKVRTALTGIAVTWGVFMLIVLLGVARGVTNKFDEEMSGKDVAVIKVWSGMTSKPYKGNREGRAIILNNRDMKDLPAQNSRYVEGVASYINVGDMLSTPKAKVMNVCRGVFPSAQNEYSIDRISEGRFINSRDLEEKAKVMVISRDYATQLFPPAGAGALGGRVDCMGLSFKIVGIYESNWRRDVYIPFTTARSLSAEKESVGNISVTLRNVHTEEDGKSAERGIRNTLASLHNFDPEDGNAIYVFNRFNDSIRIGQAMIILDTSVWVLGILTLLTGIVGISNIMFVTVRERTHEIGIRRAIGAKPRKILMQVIAESVGITLVFGYLGIVAGMAVTQVIAAVAGDRGPLLNPTVSISIAVEVTFALVLAGAAAGLFPALKALKIKPVEALRDE